MPTRKKSKRANWTERTPELASEDLVCVPIHEKAVLAHAEHTTNGSGSYLARQVPGPNRFSGLERVVRVQRRVTRTDKPRLAILVEPDGVAPVQVTRSGYWRRIPAQPMFPPSVEKPVSSSTTQASGMGVGVD